MRFIKREPNDGPKNFLKLKDGESKTGVFRGEIYAFKIKWENNKSIVVPESDPEKMNRFMLNFVTFEDGKMLAKAWEFGVTIHDQLADIHAEMDLSKTKIKITRRGTGTDTMYTLVPLGSADLKVIDGVDLQILDTTKTQPTEPDYNDPGPSLEDDIPF